MDSEAPRHEQGREETAHQEFRAPRYETRRELPSDIPGNVIANQLLRSASSVGANYRSTRRARSTAKFLARPGIVLEEADQSGLGLELIIEDSMLPRPRVEPLHTEADELCAIIYSAIHSTRTKQ